MIRTGIANYSLHPLKLKPHEVLQWAHDAGAEGVLFSDLPHTDREAMTISYLHDLGQMARDLDMYIEWGNGHHIPFNMSNWSPVDILPLNLKVAGEARAIGTRVIRTCSEGMLRANPLNPHTPELIKAVVASLKRMMPILADNGVVLAIETHFEFTSFELLRIFEMCKASPGGSLGICLDTMNLLTMLEDPVKASQRLMPWVVCTHIKDGGLVFDSHGLTAFPATIGSGIIDIGRIISLIAAQGRDINLSV
ncbi:MAG: sugar phosphate isomerase/epimerase, partial [Bacteroidetes bacterium]|nr:sugar phosphate isomerase/epimerase [Bacteroidota bacterium]